MRYAKLNEEKHIYSQPLKEITLSEVIGSHSSETDVDFLK